MSASVLTAVAAALVMVTGASAHEPVSVSARVETPAVHDDEAGGNADADDPAVWIDPADPGRGIVIGTPKEAGLDVYGLDGRRLQRIAAPHAPGKEAAPGPFNNVGIVYGFDLNGKKTDLALVSDRGRDRIRAFAIDPAAVAAGRAPFKDVTAPGVKPVFAASESEVDGQRTAYGLAAFSEETSSQPSYAPPRRVLHLVRGETGPPAQPVRPSAGGSARPVG